MGLDLWFREDVARILASTHETMAASSAAVAPLDGEAAASYQRGFVDALRAVAVAFGLSVNGLHTSPGPDVEALGAAGAILRQVEWQRRSR